MPDRRLLPVHPFRMNVLAWIHGWVMPMMAPFPFMEKTAAVNAWLLDGLRPLCNPDMWEENVLNNIVRLSDFGDTFASFSVAGVLKRGLKNHGISITRPRGFGHKREMLKAIWNAPENQVETSKDLDSTQKKIKLNTAIFKQRQIAIIGAGIGRFKLCLGIC